MCHRELRSFGLSGRSFGLLGVGLLLGSLSGCEHTISDDLGPSEAGAGGGATAGAIGSDGGQANGGRGLDGEDTVGDTSAFNRGAPPEFDRQRASASTSSGDAGTVVSASDASAPTTDAAVVDASVVDAAVLDAS